MKIKDVESLKIMLLMLGFKKIAKHIAGRRVTRFVYSPIDHIGAQDVAEGDWPMIIVDIKRDTLGYFYFGAINGTRVRSTPFLSSIWNWVQKQSYPTIQLAEVGK